jgi:serine protease Do
MKKAVSYVSVGLLAAALQAAPPQPPPPEPPKVLTLAQGGSFLGVGVTEIDNERARALNLREERGVEVTRLEDDGPAEKAGLKVGDVVLEYNGQRVDGTEQFVRLVRETPPGREVKLSVNRNGAIQTIPVKIGVRKTGTAILRSPEGFRFEIPEGPMIQIPDIPKTFMSWRSTLLGIEAESLESQLAQYFGVKEGVLVRSVLKGTTAEKAGLKAGDVITKVDGAATASPRDVSKAIRSASSKKIATLQIIREKHEMTVSVPIEEMSDLERAGSSSSTPRRAIRITTPE